MAVNSLAAELSDEIVRKSFKEASYFPIDRNFISPYIDRLRAVDEVEFIVYNLENTSNTYTVQLFLCIPEIWSEISVEDLIRITRNLSKASAFFAFIEFSYKFIEINLIDLIFGLDLNIGLKKRVIDFLLRQYTNLVKFDSDYDMINKVMGNVNYEYWLYIKQKLLLDSRVKPALKSTQDLKRYIKQLCE